MYTPTSAFKLSKDVKRRMARYTNPHEAGAYKKLMILAQLHAEEADRKPIKQSQAKQDE